VEVGGVEHALGPELVARMRVEAEPADEVA
jgi:hypothetical protein